MRRLIAVLCTALLVSATLTDPALGGAATRVPAERVCMVQDRVFSTAQIAIELQGRTYYGCCAMCEGQLRRDASLRRAKDPISGRTVDKASAVIAQTPDGSVLYFESEETFRQFTEGR
jgi:YHS domain-containing protein